MDVPSRGNPSTSPSERKIPFDDGSDLSALTSEAEEGGTEEQSDDLEENLQRPKDEDGGRMELDTKEPVPRRHQSSSDMMHDSGDEHISHARLSFHGRAMGSADKDGSQADQTPSSESEADDPDSGASFTRRGSRKPKDALAPEVNKPRGRGRPPKRQNALAAAAKRQASKSKSSASYQSDIEEHAASDTTSDAGRGRTTLVQGFSPELEEAAIQPHKQPKKRRAILTDSDDAGSEPPEQQDDTSTRDGSLSPTNGNDSASGQTWPMRRIRKGTRQRPTSRKAKTHPRQMSNDDEENDDNDVLSANGLQNDIEEDITSEAERLNNPPPPFPDDSDDEDYVDPSASASASRATSARRGRRAVSTHISPRSRRVQRNRETSALSETRSHLDEVESQGDVGPSEMSTSRKLTSENQSGSRTDLIGTKGESEEEGDDADEEDDPSDGFSDDQLEGASGDPSKEDLTRPALVTSIQASLTNGVGREALSDLQDGAELAQKLPEDVPILLEATARAVGAGLSGDGSAPNARLRPLTTESIMSEQEGDDEPATPDLLQPPALHVDRGKSPPVSSQEKGKSAWLRAHGKMGRHSNLLDQDDAGASASAPEDAGVDGEGDLTGTPGLETPAGSDHEEGEHR